MSLIIIVIIVILTVVYFISGSKTESNSNVFFITTEGQSDERISSLNLFKPSENASSNLDSSKLIFPRIKRDVENMNYEADPEHDWIINLLQVNGKDFNKKDAEKIFDNNWRHNFPSTIYGFSEEENRWVYVFAGDAPLIYSKIQIAINVREIYNEDHPVYSPTKLERYIVELERLVKKFPTELRIEQTGSLQNAINKGKKNVELYNEFNIDQIIVLKSQTVFNGLKAWDALLCVGLKWGDGDLFHWRNNEDYGHDQHFSVWTSTNPGYFFPEKIKKGQMNPSDLIFGFSIPRSADPKNVFDAMFKAVMYCKQRLGGTILNNSGTLFEYTTELKNLSELTDQMREKGLIPGSDKVLSMF